MMKPPATFPIPTVDRVVLAHDWLTGMRGGEKCLEAACRRWPDAPLFTLLHKRGSVTPTIEAMLPRVSHLGRLPGVHRYYRYLLPLMPKAARWPIPDCDAVLSFSHCVAKSAEPPPGAPHVSYCFTPMRYAWHMKDAYFGPMKRLMVSPLLRRLRDWDRRTADRVTHFIAISRTIQDRIRDCYGRPSTIIYPPVDTDFYTPAAVEREPFYLVVSALAPYKRFDLAIDACRRLGRRLVVIGSGQSAQRLRRLAGPGIEFLGWQSDEVIRDYYRKANALLFPAEEDFGIVPLEAQACGCPVIALGRGGATETVRPLDMDRPTGVFFAEQTVASVIAAIETFEANKSVFDPAVIRRHALPFQQSRYERELCEYVEAVIAGRDSIRKAA
jgi:glycosyltransferase involved in cell wall biosynthesis